MTKGHETAIRAADELGMTGGAPTDSNFAAKPRCRRISKAGHSRFLVADIGR